MKTTNAQLPEVHDKCEEIQSPTEPISKHNNTYPRLKNGVYISRASITAERSIHLATSHYAIEIFHLGARAIIAQLTGSKTPEEISLFLSAPIHIVDSVLTELKDANFIDTVKNKITLHNRFQSSIASRAAHTQDQTLDGAFSQLQKRLAPELSQATWIDGASDGGVTLLSTRQDFGVEIYGSSRTATLICSILLASGVTNTRISLSSMQKHSTISDSDLGSGALRTSDIGLNFRVRMEELSREWSLFPVASHQASTHKPLPEVVLERSLRIIVGSYEPELINSFVRDGADHLFVGRVAGGVATCGPLVRPALTPCIYCHALGVEERQGGFQSALEATHGTSEELPIAVAHQIASIAAQTAISFIDTGVTPLMGAQIQVNYLTPLTPTINRFARHPKCNCMWGDIGKVQERMPAQELALTL